MLFHADRGHSVPTFCAIHGIHIGYAPAEFFDEQPVTFKASWKQRMRWTRAFTRCSLPTVSIQSSRRSAIVTAAYDMFMTIAPNMLLSR
ncbi:MAG: hypothetical protein ACLU0O_00875 [Collinsella sp.]